MDAPEPSLIVGGTSAAAPLWAGFMALVNQNSQKNGFEPKSGFVNPALYFIGKTRVPRDPECLSNARYSPGSRSSACARHLDRQRTRIGHLLHRVQFDSFWDVNRDLV